MAKKVLASSPSYLTVGWRGGPCSFYWASRTGRWAPAWGHRWVLLPIWREQEARQRELPVPLEGMGGGQMSSQWGSGPVDGGRAFLSHLHIKWRVTGVEQAPASLPLDRSIIRRRQSFQRGVFGSRHILVSLSSRSLFSMSYFEPPSQLHSWSSWPM